MKMLIFSALFSFSAYANVDPLSCFNKLEEFVGIYPGEQMDLSWEYGERNLPCQVQFKYNQHMSTVTNKEVKQFYFRISAEGKDNPLVILAHNGPLSGQVITLCEAVKGIEHNDEKESFMLVTQYKATDGAKYNFSVQLNKAYGELSQAALYEEKVNSYKLANLCYNPFLFNL